MKAVKTPIKNLNNLRIELLEKELMDISYKIKTDDYYGYIPIKDEKNIYNDLEIVDIDLKKVKLFPKNFTELLDDKLNENDLEKLKTSFDIIGDIVILEIPKNLENKKIAIGEAALEFTKRKSVYMKKSPIEGKTRVRKIEFLAGINNPITIHKEHKNRLKLDVSKVYFSPRLATERLKIAEDVKDNEEILDMFCGIGPFPIIIASKKKVKVTAVDINKIAIGYLKENIELNKLKGEITPINQDINNLNINKKFNRIIMNLPGTSYEFLDLAIDLIENNGIINYYEFSSDYTQGINRIDKAASKKNKKVEILSTRKVKSNSPRVWHIAIDARVLD
ncbi:MAG: class I SAM-dependent methyltransferase family protein [Methanobacteriaceae archaeon]|jgi:tRNA (guanine37-N1)-methyltransferase|nr:class I SAM-dependent methyltransferase family protein [Methanobacteriaceae archaeon]